MGKKEERLKQLSENDGVLLASDSLSAWTERLLTEVGVPGERARLITDNLVSAEMCGVGSHGLSRLSIYLERLTRGLIDAGAELVTLQETASTLLLDAQNGFGHAAAAEAVEKGVCKARLSGVCALAIRNSTHFGRAGHFAEQAARHGCIGVITTNSAARMAPWGSKEPMVGTNPLAIGIPGQPDPILLDMSTSVAALGKIVLADKTGTPIPEGWALDSDGHPTTDATLALKGSLVPVAGPKGSGLALILDILSGVLSGAEAGRGVGSLYRDFTRPEGCGHFMIIVDVAAFIPLDTFRRCVADYAAVIRATEPISVEHPVLLPGELEQRRKMRSLETGIVLATDVYRELLELSKAHGVVFPEPVQT